MLRKLGKVGAAVAVLCAVAVGSAAIAGAAQNGALAAGPGAHGGPGSHRPETALTGTTEAKVRDAALAKVTGGSIIRVETNTDGGGPYEAHIQKSDGSQVVVLVDKAFKATSVEPFGPPRS